MSEQVGRAEMIEAAAELRARSDRLREIADQVGRAADALELAIHGGEQAILRGHDLVDALLRVIAPGERLHYRDAERRLHAAGFTAGGVDPSATLLAQINRAPEFESCGRRSGLYVRKPASTQLTDSGEGEHHG